ncbi:MAG: ABC transporter permease [Bacteroidota bacterium]
MRTVLSIINSELKQRLASWISVIFFLMLVFQGIWYTKGSFDYFINEQVLMNAPSIFYRNFAGMGMLMVIIIAIVTGGVLYKDIQYKTAGWVYAMPISEKKFFLGRFIAAFLYLVIISTGLIVGHILVPFSGIGESHQFGPTPWGQMLHGWVLFTIPNLFFYVSLVFFSVVITRRAATGYLAVFLVVILFLIAQTSYETGGANEYVGYILGDPGGYVAAQYYSDLLTPIQKNNDYFPLSGYILQNRLLWGGLAMLLFLVTYRRFSFKYFIQAGIDKSRKVKEKHFIRSSESVFIPTVNRAFTTGHFIKKLWTLSKVEFLNIVRPLHFKIILGIVLLMVFLQNMTWNAHYYIGKEVPISSNMTYFRLQWGVFVTMLVIIWAGELFFKDKTINIWQITDSLPVPTWVTQVSKFVAIIGLSFVLSLSFIAMSIFTQVLLGGAAYIDVGRFAEDLLLYRWGFLNFVLYTSLTFVLASLTSNRLLTHILSVGIFLFLIISFDMGLMEQLKYGYALTPGIEDYSDISGYGIFQTSANWFFFMWLALAISFLLLGIWVWRRGADKRWAGRLSLTNKQLSWVAKGVLVGCFAAFISLFSYINTHAYRNGNFTAEEDQERLDAEYEKTYQYLAATGQPLYEHVDLSLDLFPSMRKAEYQMEARLSNPLVDTLILNWPDFVDVRAISLNGQSLSTSKEDTEQNLSFYVIPETIKGDSSFRLSIEANKQYVGISQSDFQADLTFDGSLGSIKDFLPTIGYDSEVELEKNRLRLAQGLEKLDSRMADVEDQAALERNIYASDAMKVTGTITISTHKDQVPFAPGILLSKAEGERNVYQFSIDKATPFDWHIGSASYAVAEGTASPVSYSILHNPSHTFNLELYHDALKKGIQYMDEILGIEELEEIRLVEVHKWQEDRYVFPNSIALSEKEGWVADTKGLKEKAYIYQTIGSGIAQLWVQQHLSIADVQGADMLAVALPEALGLSFVEHVLGSEAAKQIIEKKMDAYAKDRNNEPNQEPPLLYADGTDYLEMNKGAVTLYKVLQQIGIDAFVRVLLDQPEEEGTITFHAIYHQIAAQLSEELKSEISSG